MQHKFLTMKDASINVTLPFAALAIGDVQQLIRSIVADEVRKVIPHVEPTKPTPDAMTVDQVLPFLSEQGLPTTKKTLYNWIFRGVIPYKHIGRARSIFPKRAAVVDRIPYRPFGRQAGRCCIAYLRECKS